MFCVMREQPVRLALDGGEKHWNACRVPDQVTARSYERLIGIRNHLRIDRLDKTTRKGEEENKLLSPHYSTARSYRFRVIRGQGRNGQGLTGGGGIPWK